MPSVFPSLLQAPSSHHLLMMFRAHSFLHHVINLSLGQYVHRSQVEPTPIILLLFVCRADELKANNPWRATGSSLLPWEWLQYESTCTAPLCQITVERVYFFISCLKFINIVRQNLRFPELIITFKDVFEEYLSERVVRLLS